MRLLPLVAAATAAFLVVACSSPTPPRGVTVVNNFDAKRYLGTWYEIARFDHRFERGLEKVTATYSLRDDGGLNVINKGYNPDREMWQQSEGKAYFTGAPTRAALKVSFFGPFYGGYNVIALDREYRHALVCGPDRDYLWILSRTPTISDEVKQEMLAVATREGFDVSKFIWVQQPGSEWGLSFRPIIPNTINARLARLIGLADSPSSTMPVMAAPTAPIPVHTA